jgi:hypothetical protein
LSAESPSREFGAGRTRLVVVVLLSILMLFAAACGGQASDGSSNDSGRQEASGTREHGATSTASSEKSEIEESVAEKARDSGEAAQLARAEVGKKEITNMIPADGKKPDAAQPLPENPPKGIEVYPAATNASTRGPIDYQRHPPTNGDHAPIWQNCGFYEKPVENGHAVHSLDHGVVWITYRPDLPQQQLQALRPYGKENYVIVSPYPDQDPPVIATSWRVRLELNGPNDPRLRRFVNQFRISALAPLSGNRCVLGVGNPEG